MKSWWMQLGDQGAILEQRESAVPSPGPQQVVVRVRAASLNRGEFVAGHGLHGAPGSWKAVGGECAGEVAVVGADVSGFRPGDRVMGRCSGGFAEYAVVDAAEAMLVPDGLAWEAAASIPLTYLVAFDMVVLQGRLQAGEWLLVNGVSSGVGVASLQLAKVLDAKVIGTSGSQDKLEALKELGLDVALCTRKADFAPAVLDVTGKRGADLAINTVGGSVFAEDVRALAFQGRLAVVGYVDGVLHAEIDLEAVHSKRLSIVGVSNKLRTKAQKSAAVPRFVAEILPHFAAGRITPRVDRVFDFDELPQAKSLMEAGGHTGKIVLRIAA